MKVKADGDESSLYAAMLVAQDVSQRCKELVYQTPGHRIKQDQDPQTWILVIPQISCSLRDED